MTRKQGILVAALVLALAVLAIAPFDYTWRSPVIDAQMGRATTYTGRTAGQLWAPPTLASIHESMRSNAARDPSKAAWALADVSDIRPAWTALVGRLAVIALLAALAIVFVGRQAEPAASRER